MTVKGVCESGKLPAAKVTCEEKRSLATRESAFEVFEAVVDDNLCHIFARIAGEEADLGELPPQRDVLPAKRAAALAHRHFRKGQGQIPHADSAQSSQKNVHQQAKADADRARQRTR